VEKEVDGKDSSRLMPLLREHLDMCSDCCDEYEALLDVIEKSVKV
jgi:predicted anti-sigma-YlaC factor YlaD